MAMLKLKKKPAPPGGRPYGVDTPARPPLRGRGATPRPTLAQAEAGRARRQAERSGGDDRRPPGEHRPADRHGAQADDRHRRDDAAGGSAGPGSGHGGHGQHRGPGGPGRHAGGDDRRHASQGAGRPDSGGQRDRGPASGTEPRRDAWRDGAGPDRSGGPRDFRGGQGRGGVQAGQGDRHHQGSRGSHGSQGERGGHAGPGDHRRTDRPADFDRSGAPGPGPRHDGPSREAWAVGRRDAPDPRRPPPYREGGHGPRQDGPPQHPRGDDRRPFDDGGRGFRQPDTSEPYRADDRLRPDDAWRSGTSHGSQPPADGPGPHDGDEAHGGRSGSGGHDDRAGRDGRFAPDGRNQRSGPGASGGYDRSGGHVGPARPGGRDERAAPSGRGGPGDPGGYGDPRGYGDRDDRGRYGDRSGPGPAPRQQRPASSGGTVSYGDGRPAQDRDAGMQPPRRPAWQDDRDRRGHGAGPRPFEPARPPAPQRHDPRRGADDDRDGDEPPAHAPGSLRLSKRMAQLGLASRREADEWIAQGFVRVDGKVVSTLGARVQPEQQVTIDARARRDQAQWVTILLHKPLGFVSGQAEDDHQPVVVLVKPQSQWHGDTSGRRFEHVHLRGIAPAGRLDLDSTGLLVLTQDGRIAKQLIGEDSTVEKEYRVSVERAGVARVAAETETDAKAEAEAGGEAAAEAHAEDGAETEAGAGAGAEAATDIGAGSETAAVPGDGTGGAPSPLPSEDGLALLRHGLELDGEALKPAQVDRLDDGRLRFVLAEGKKRQIRRMCEAVGLKVTALERVRIGNVSLGELPPGQWRYLRDDEAFG